MKYHHRITSIMRIASFLMSRDVKPGDFLKRLALPPGLFLDEDVWLPRAISFQLVTEMVRATGEPLSGIHVASFIEFADYGDWGRRILTAPTLRDAITTAGNEVWRVETGTHLRLHEVGSTAHLWFDYDGNEVENGSQFDAGNLMLLRKLVDLSNEPVPALATFSSEHAHAEALEGWFGPDLSFGARHSGLVFDRAALAMPLHSWSHEPSPRARPSWEPARLTGYAVMHALRETIAFDRPTAAAVASRLSIGVRQMQRHLAQWGTTFEDVLDEYRKRLATEYLQTGDQSITLVAMKLGYSDSAHFTRAFRRWNGASPREYLKARKATIPQAVPG